MLGFNDFFIFLAYILCVLSMVLCVVYGAVNWNKGLQEEQSQIQEEKEWEKGEEELNKELGE